MSDDIINLRSVNWSQGMFLTPDHFLRQERYLDSSLLWILRYVSPAAGLIGGGPRVDAAERGAARFDPIVEVDDGGDSLKVMVTQCRGMTAGGGVVEVDPSNALSASFSKTDLEGVLDFGIYVVARPHDKEPDEAVEDPINPQFQSGRRLHYRISLEPTAEEAPWSLQLIRLRRAERGLRFERVPDFIPSCVFMSAHSELMHAFRQLNERVAAIADHYSALHRAMVDFLTLARSRGLNADQDAETLTFVSRMVMTLEECAYRILDPLQPPKQFFQQMNQLIRSSALFLSLSPPAREYFRLLGEIGETEFVSWLEQEGEALEMGRRWSLHDDLGVEVTKVARALDRLDRLEQALEGKYMDYRISPSLESINFVFDRTSGDPVLYKSVAKPARPQAHGQELTFVFAPLRLEAREQYRVILVGDRQAKFVAGDGLTAELRINPGEGYRHAPEYRTTQYEIDSQRNFAIDFSAPEDVVSINDVRVSLRSSQPIRSAILYVRARLMEGAPLRSVASSQALPSSRKPPVAREERRPMDPGRPDRPDRAVPPAPRPAADNVDPPPPPPVRKSRLS
jgi:hypothetical protein